MRHFSETVDDYQVYMFSMRLRASKDKMSSLTLRQAIYYVYFHQPQVIAEEIHTQYRHS